MAEVIQEHKSVGRMFRQMFYIPMFHTRWLNDATQQHLSEKTTEAEKNHRGEIRVVVENTLPVLRSYSLTPRARAIELFSDLRVWDTDENTGVLVYVNICEHDLEIVADRGINAHVEQSTWQDMCDRAIAGIRADKPVESIENLLMEIGDLLRQFYELVDDPAGNELCDQVLYLRSPLNLMSKGVNNIKRRLKD